MLIDPHGSVSVGDSHKINVTVPGGDNVLSRKPSAVIGSAYRVTCQ